MTRVAIPEVKDTLRTLTIDTCQAAAVEVIGSAADGTEARATLERLLGLEPAPVAGRRL